MVKQSTVCSNSLHGVRLAGHQGFDPCPAEILACGESIPALNTPDVDVPVLRP